MVGRRVFLPRLTALSEQGVCPGHLSGLRPSQQWGCHGVNIHRMNKWLKMETHLELRAQGRHTTTPELAQKSWNWPRRGFHPQTLLPGLLRLRGVGRQSHRSCPECSVFPPPLGLRLQPRMPPGIGRILEHSLCSCCGVLGAEVGTPDPMN